MNYTGISGLPLDALQTLLVFLTSPTEVRSALEFDISAVPAGVVIESAVLSLWGVLFDTNIAVHAYAGNGVVDFNDFLVFALRTQITTFDPGPTNTIDVTGGVRTLYESGASYAGFQLRELTQNDPTLFFSRLSPEVNLRPRLDIEFSAVPEPVTWLLLGSGLIGLAGFTRKRFRK
jgi:hypothetical protein